MGLSLKVIAALCLIGSALGRYAVPRVRLGLPKFSSFVDGRITKGSTAEIGQFPHQVSLRWDFYYPQHFCGGAIISPEWVLTAAHCITDLPKFGLVVVTAGVNNFDIYEKTEQSIDVDEKFVHEKFKGGVGPYDIALLKLKSPLTLSKAVAPISLPIAGVEPCGDVVLSGWGSVSTTDRPIMPSQLQTANLTIIDYETCSDALKKLVGNSLLEKTNICTGPLTGGAVACAGDSGGPLIAFNRYRNVTEIVGVASWGVFPCGTDGAPSIYTKVSAYVDWIQDTIAKN
ncbi:trypsin-like [Prorops nasuta]|uniref:trypsin-like n=1 Tax=Prorops nasuta TaxID=863751 RepID=UPI0034CFC4D2